MRCVRDPTYNTLCSTSFHPGMQWCRDAGKRRVAGDIAHLIYKETMPRQLTHKHVWFHKRTEVKNIRYGSFSVCVGNADTVLSNS